MFPSVRSHRLGSVALILALCLLVSACGKNKVTKTNFDKITNGMTLEQVEGVLGKGTKDTGDGSNVAGQFGVAITSTPTSGAAEIYVWETSTKSIKVFFAAGKVVNKTQSGL